MHLQDVSILSVSYGLAFQQERRECSSEGTLSGVPAGQRTEKCEALERDSQGDVEDPQSIYHRERSGAWAE